MAHPHNMLTKFAGIPLVFLTDDGGKIPDWHRDLVRNERKVPASNRTIEQIDGYTPWRLTIRVMFANTEAWQLFSRQRGFSGEMWQPGGTSAEFDGAVQHFALGKVYAIWPNVYLESIDRGSVRPLRDGRVIARATFRRESTEVYGW